MGYKVFPAPVKVLTASEAQSAVELTETYRTELTKQHVAKVSEGCWSPRRESVGPATLAAQLERLKSSRLSIGDMSQLAGKAKYVFPRALLCRYSLLSDSRSQVRNKGGILSSL